jgi:predicted ATPase
MPLYAPGEADYAVEPLPTPTEDLSGDKVLDFASVRLFLDRGRAFRRDLATTASDLATVARICRELATLVLGTLNVAVDSSSSHWQGHGERFTAAVR